MYTKNAVSCLLLKGSPLKNFRTVPALPAFAYVKKETHLEVHELGFVFYKLWTEVLTVPGTVAFMQPSNLRENQNTLQKMPNLIIINK